jgi:hypothetical protein
MACMMQPMLTGEHMNEWIIAPLLAPDPTGIVSHTPGAKESVGPDNTADNADVDADADADASERRHGDRRDGHEDDADPDFARGIDRRDDVV